MATIVVAPRSRRARRRGVRDKCGLDVFGLDERRRERMGERAGFAARPEREVRAQEGLLAKTSSETAAPSRAT